MCSLLCPLWEIWAILLENSCLHWDCHIGFAFWQIFNISSLLQVSQRTGLQYFDSYIPTFFQSSLGQFSSCVISRNKLISLTFFNNLWAFRNYPTCEFLKALMPQKQYPNSYYGKVHDLPKSHLCATISSFADRKCNHIASILLQGLSSKSLWKKLKAPRQMSSP